MHDDELDPDDELAELIADDELAEDEAELSEQDLNGRTLSIRGADGEEIVSIQSTARTSFASAEAGGLDALVGGAETASRR